MKAILEYDLNDEEDQERFKRATIAKDMLQALYEVKDLLRSWDKYGIPEQIIRDIDLSGSEDASADVVEILRQQINTIIYERVGEI